jgi:hypothetical protein
MGLDMYLEGRTFNWKEKYDEDGFRIKGKTIELGYWRKHPNLHGYIVEAFADGIDDCKPIHLTTLDMQNIISAIREKRLPKTEGFFFGESDGSEDAESIEIFKQAIKWLDAATPPKREEPVEIGPGMTAVRVEPKNFVGAEEGRDVFYEASW